MSYEHVEIVREGVLTIVKINRPSAHNSLNAKAQYELEAVFDAFDSDDSQWIAIVTGSGDKAFCAGLDLKEQAEVGGLVNPPSGFGGLTSRVGFNKPVIAAVNGAAMGGGFEIVLACDIVVASAHAVFALPEPRVGLAALAGGLQRLPREVGLKHAMGLLLTGRRIKADEALQLGIINEVVNGNVLDAARRWASEILACSPLATRATKDAVMRGLNAPIIEAIAAQWGYPAMKTMLHSDDAVEGPAAFAAKRTPEWTGR